MQSNQNVSLLRDLLKEGFERATGWLHVLAAMFAFTGDFLTKVFPYCRLWLAILGFVAAAVLFVLAAQFRKASEKFAAVFAASLILAILSLALLGLDRFIPNENGVLVALVPGLEGLQEQLFAVKQDTEALLKAQREEKERAEQRQTELKSLVIDAAGGGAPAVRAVADIRDLLRRDVPGIDEIPAEKLPGAVKRILEDLHKPAAKTEEFFGTVKRVLTEAQAQAAELKFADAAKVLDATLARTETEDKDRARGHAALLAERGRIARLQLRYRDAAGFYAKAAEAAAFDPAVAWSHTLDRAGALYAQGEEFGDNQALEDAIRVYRSALDMAPRARVPLDWATTQMNLGVALAVLGERESGTARLEEAVAAYRDALQEYTRARVPLDWARTQMNLGVALFRLGERESGTARLDEAVSAYREALQERTRARAPLEWAGTEINLGAALRVLGERESGTARLQEAVAAYREALQENTRARVPLLWAMTQMNLGNALQTLGERESGTARLEEAVASYREALKENTHARAPLRWAMTQNNLGVALETLGERESGTARLEEAVSAYREAMQENTRARVPLDWAMTQMNLGNVLSSLGERESGTARLEEAAAAFREALKEYTRARAPLDWARTQNNLGNALESLGARESGIARLQEAVSAYREALQERTRARVPLQWARTTGNQGVALMLLAERRRDAKMAKLALQQIEAAFTASRDGGDAPSAAEFEAQLPKARVLAQKLAKR